MRILKLLGICRSRLGIFKSKLEIYRGRLLNIVRRLGAFRRLLGGMVKFSRSILLLFLSFRGRLSILVIGLLLLVLGGVSMLRRCLGRV